VLALQVKISGGIKIYQALLHALVMPSNPAQGTIKFVQCTPIACLYRYRSGTATASDALRIAHLDLGASRSIIESVHPKSRTSDAARAPGVLKV
jgi:hypothetical protein